MAVTKTALVAHSGTIARLCELDIVIVVRVQRLVLTKDGGLVASLALPKAIDRLSAEMGGLTALQREGISCILVIFTPMLPQMLRYC